MSEYFTNIPNIYYKFDQITNVSGKKVDKIHEKLATDITLRQKLKSSLKDDLLTFYSYRVKDGERPDTISQIYYGSIKYTWLVFLSNNIFDPIFEWPMSHSELETHIASKYGSLNSAISTVHHYEEIIQSFVEAGFGNPRIEERTIEIDNTRFLSLSTSGATNTKTITNYEYELNYNEQKKEIVLIEDIYADDILQNARDLFGNTLNV
tara:strand:- start:4198 stop:4821 length:624 start_codon:yes stop_codon:yes gene_type:complete